MKSIEEVQEEIVDEFTSVDDWMDRYTMIIEEGNTLPPLPEQYRTPSNLIEGCQSRVWVNAELTPEGRIHFEADSDALIVKGIIALLVKVLMDAYLATRSGFLLRATGDNPTLVASLAKDSGRVKILGLAIVKVLDTRTPDEVISADLHFINDIGLGENLSPTRSNGLLAMIKQMRLYAMAFKAKQGL